MPEGKSITLYWSSQGNTQKVAQRIHDTLLNAGIQDALHRVSKDLNIEYRDYNLIFVGAPVYENLPPPPVIDFLKRHKKRGVEILASAPERPGMAAVLFCTYGGGHTALNEAVPGLKYMGQFFEHEGIRVVDEIAVPGFFPGAKDPLYNTRGRLGDITRRPDEHDLAEVAARIQGILRRLRLVLPLGDLTI